MRNIHKRCVAYDGETLHFLQTGIQVSESLTNFGLESLKQEFLKRNIIQYPGDDFLQRY